MVIAVLLSTGKAFCEATAVQASYTLVQPTVAVEKASSVEAGSIDSSLGGKSSILSSTFNLQANDETTFFLVYSTIQVSGGKTISAFDLTGNLMFANTTVLPTETDIDRARIAQTGNANVIVYPFKLSGENVEATYTYSREHKECYMVNLEDPLLPGVLIQTIGGMPIANTYSTRDQVGSYKVTVYVEAATEL